MIPIAHIHSPFPSKFGIPRQSNIVESLKANIVFEPDYRNIEALRGIEEFSYIWLIWQFSENMDSPWSPTVRPPRLGGNKRMGVFATRSPFRPNPIGLSSVRLTEVLHHTSEGPQLIIEGPDLMDGTPIYDIKPYIPYTDAHPDARSGFASTPNNSKLRVTIPDDISRTLDPVMLQSLRELLALDPRPSYHDDTNRIYGLPFYHYEIHFRVDKEHLVVTSIADNTIKNEGQI
ncbi:MAG: tRNA (N6-threonylcarbamoyladenosine(37)-N6)-methyltransferase TrmO [Bacteroidales bacterium]|nr:tRNA (N6-threonylcarbamoyladenosine(37)-N6)-methyltransferase TrmO [Bacteroidales bacterium]